MEVLQQRTRAETIAKVYPVFFGRFSSWGDIAAAPVEELEEHFKPIGLWNKRARSMRALAEYAAARHGQFDTGAASAHDGSSMSERMAHISDRE